ncbi:MAG: RNA methyltransferase [Myxococcales bacterium]|nr:RNA methyltransferase [Myxococcales bacterium]MCB9521898.1 RNA methyltransferase [Myxococcales bacterium]
MANTPVTVEIDGRTYPAGDVIDALRPHLYPERVNRMEWVLAHRLQGVALGVEDLHKSHNGQACIRTAEGLGLQDVVAVELRNAYPLEIPERDPTERSVDRISRWAHRWVDLHRLDSRDAALGWARDRGMRIVGAGPRGEQTLESLSVDRPLLVLFGNEAEGLAPETLEACDDTFRIPMFGFTESFNVSVSVGMVLGRLATRYREGLAAQGRTTDLSEARRLKLLAEWVAHDVKAAGPILRRKLG